MPDAGINYGTAACEADMLLTELPGLVLMSKAIGVFTRKVNSTLPFLKYTSFECFDKYISFFPTCFLVVDTGH